MRHSKTTITSLVFLLILEFGTGCSTKFIRSGCTSYKPEILAVNDSYSFNVLAINQCNPSGIVLEKDEYYEFKVEVKNKIEDGSIKCKPGYYNPKTETCMTDMDLGSDGFNTKKMGFFPKIFLAIGQPFRPIGTPKANWFELVGTTGQSNRSFFSIYQLANKQEPLKAKDTGELFCLVNDYPYLKKYENNKGSFLVTVKHVPTPK